MENDYIFKNFLLNFLKNVLYILMIKSNGFINKKKRSILFFKVY